MLKKALVLCCLGLAVALLSSPGFAFAWGPSDLTAYGSDEKVVVTPSFAPDGDYYIYTYEYNNTARNEIESIDLTFPDSVDVMAFSELTGPWGWGWTRRAAEHQIDCTVGIGDPLAAGDTASFSFRAKYAPSTTKVVTATARDGVGWNGDTYGPIPEPSSLAALMFGAVSLVGFRLKRR
jgi:hypothetical protein